MRKAFAVLCCAALPASGAGSPRQITFGEGVAFHERSRPAESPREPRP
jgi:hypothetical protein